MTLPSGAHVELGGVGFMLDEGYESLTGRRCYVHGGRDIFAEQFNITGIPGARNLRQEDLIWALTNFDGEGQVVLDASDEESARLFYRSEGLNFRVGGQFSLNKSSVSQSLPLAGPTATTFQGAADMTDVVGTSTTSGTDRRIAAVSDQIGTNANHAPGASNVQADFYLYVEDFGDNDTSIAGSALKLYQGDGAVSGADFRLRPAISSARTTTKSTGTHFTAGVLQRVELYCHVSAADAQPSSFAQLLVLDVTGNTPKAVALDVVDVANIGTTDNPTTATAAVNFTPAANRDYRFHVNWVGWGAQPKALLVDEFRYGPEVGTNRALIEVYNNTTLATVTTKTVTVNSTAANNLTGSISFTAAAATNYRYRVTRVDTTGADPQAIWADKITATLKSATVWVNDCIEVGLGGRIWAGAHTAAGDTRVWRYDPVDDTWEDSGGTVGSYATLNDGAATTGAVVRAMSHSDAFEYVLLSNDEVYTVTAAAANDRYAYFSANGRDLVGMTIAQERLMLMSEDTNGVVIYSVPLDDTTTNPWNLNNAALSAGVQTLTLTAGQKSPDTNLRQRMCSTPTGARFFVNYGDATAKIYQVDSSGATLTYRELADLGHGVEAKAIAYEGGLTFIAGTYVAESDQTARSALWYIDTNGVLERLGILREDSPAAYEPIDIEPYQTEVYILQGPFVWRYSLRFGGLFCEYELGPTTGTEARSLAVSQGRTFALYEDEIIVTGTESTYRQSSVTDGNTYTSSIYDYGLPGVTKSLNEVHLLTDTMATGARVSLFYQIDQSGTWVPIGTATEGATNSHFNIANPQTPVTFNTLQIRAMAESTTGANTPVVRGIILKSAAAENEEYFDLVLRTEDEDSSDHIDNQQPAGGQAAAYVVSLWRSGTPVEFADGYETNVGGQFSSYLCVIRDVRVEQTARGEGRTVLTLKVLN